MRFSFFYFFSRFFGAIFAAGPVWFNTTSTFLRHFFCAVGDEPPQSIFVPPYISWLIMESFFGFPHALRWDGADLRSRSLAAKTGQGRGLGPFIGGICNTQGLLRFLSSPLLLFFSLIPPPDLLHLWRRIDNVC